MFHFNTQRLIEYWRGLRTAGLAPARASVDPAALAEVLPQMFIVGRVAPALPFRLAGGLLVDLHGRGLRDESFLSLWTGDSRAAVRDAAAGVAREGEPVVLFAEGRARRGDKIGVELSLAPLTGPTGAIDRLIGLYQPQSDPARLHGDTIVELTHRLTVFVGQAADRAAAAPLKLAAMDGRRIA